MSGTIHFFDECVVCHDPNPSHLFKPCNHKCICVTCAGTYTKSKNLQTCPLCRKKYVFIKRDDSKPKKANLNENEQLARALKISLQEAKQQKAKRKEEESALNRLALSIKLEAQPISELSERKRILSSIIDLVKREAAKIESGLLQSLSVDMAKGAQFARDEVELRLIQNVENAFSRIKESIKLRRSVQLDESYESIGFIKTTEFGSTHQLPNTGFFSSANVFGTPSTTSNTFSFALSQRPTLLNSQKGPFGPPSRPWSLSFGNTSQTSNSLFSNATTPIFRFGKNFNFNQSNEKKRSFEVPSTPTFNFGHGQTTAFSEGIRLSNAHQVVLVSRF